MRKLPAFPGDDSQTNQFVYHQVSLWERRWGEQGGALVQLIDALLSSGEYRDSKQNRKLRPLTPSQPTNHSSSMPKRSAVSLEEGESHDSLAADINETVDVFLGALKEIAEKHGR